MVDELKNEDGMTEAEIIEHNKKFCEEIFPGWVIHNDIGKWKDPHFYYVTYNEECDCIDIRSEKSGYRYEPYAIELNRIKTKSDLIAKIHHLTEKRWITQEHIHKFIGVVCSKRGWKIY